MKKNNKKGFTLVELVIVVAVMAVLVAVAIPTVKSITGTAKSAVAETNAKTIESMIKLLDADIQTGKSTYSTFNETAIDGALTDAQLNIDGYFLYDSNKGTVTVGSESTTAASGQYLIVCNSKATASGEGNSEQTAEQNSVKVTKGA